MPQRRHQMAVIARTSLKSKAVLMLRLGLRVYALALKLVEKIHRTPQMGDHDRTADHQCNTEGFEKFVAVDARFLALGNVIADAIIAAQHHGSDQTQ